MPDPLIVVDRSMFRRERSNDLRRGFVDLASFVRDAEPRPVAYHVYMDDPTSTVTVFQIHPDVASLVEHMDVAGARFAPFAALLRMTSLDVYGSVDDRALERLHAKASMLGTGAVTVHERIAGFDRFGHT